MLEAKPTFHWSRVCKILYNRCANRKIWSFNIISQRSQVSKKSNIFVERNSDDYGVLARNPSNAIVDRRFSLSHWVAINQYRFITNGSGVSENQNGSENVWTNSWKLRLSRTDFFFFSLQQKTFRFMLTPYRSMPISNIVNTMQGAGPALADALPNARPGRGT